MGTPLFDANPMELLSGAGFDDAEALALGHLFSPQSQVEAEWTHVLDEGLNIVGTDRTCTIALRAPKEVEVTLDSPKIAALCYLIAAQGNIEARKGLVVKLGNSVWRERVPLICRFVNDPDLEIQRLAQEYLRSLSPGIHEVLTVLTEKPHRYFLSQPYVPFPRGLASIDVAEGSSGARIGLSNVPPDSGGGRDGGPPGDPLEVSSDPHEEARPGPSIVQRFTHVEFRAAQATPVGDLLFGLRVKSASVSDQAVDVRVPEGKDHAAVLVFASSSTFAVDPALHAIKVPRSADSEDAVFKIDGQGAADQGEVSLLIYDEYRLIGCLSVPLSRITVDGRVHLELGAGGPDLSRDPATAPQLATEVVTMQASMRQSDRKIQFHLHRPPEKEGGAPRLVELGTSAERFDSSTVQQALGALRVTVDKIEQGLDNPKMLGAETTAEALEYLAMSLSGYGLKIADDILSVEARTLLTALPEGSAVQWVVADQTLDAIPWELARDPLTRSPINQRIVLLRVPAPRPSQAGGALSPTPSAGAAPLPPELVYVLGDGVYNGNTYDPVRKSVQSAARHRIVTNFEQNKREPVSAVRFKKLVRSASVIYVLCHGVVDERAGLHLEIETKPLGWLSPFTARDLDFAGRPLVFINACSSSTATWSVGGFTTFGWSFLQAGASVFIGALAPVPTSLAMQFAEHFFEAHLGRGMSVPAAIYETRRQLAAGQDPTWLFYTVYGDVSTMTGHA